MCHYSSTPETNVELKEGELFRKFEETHYQKGYTAEEMKAFLKEAGLEFVSMCDSDTQKDVTEDTERICMIAKECRKSR